MHTRKVLLATICWVAMCCLAFGGVSLPRAPALFQEVLPSSAALPVGSCSCLSDAGAVQGLCLTGQSAMHEVMQCSDNSQFDGGSAKAYFCDSAIGAWVKASTVNDFSLPANTLLPDAGAPGAIGPELQVVYPFGRFKYVTVAAACTGASWDGGVISSLVGAQQ